MGTELAGNPISTGIYFAYGYSLYKNTKLFHNIIHNWKYYFLSAILFFLIHTLIEEEYISIDFEQFPVFWIPFIFIKISNSILFSFSFIGLAENKFGSYNSILRFCSDGTYWMYLIHLPIVTFITFFMFQFELFAEFKFLLAIILTTFICLITYKFFVRSTCIGILLNGRKYPFKWNNFN
jgi:glucan biosynthesis protein C